MKGTVKKIISGIAAVAVMLTAMVAFVSCGSGEDGINRNWKYVMFNDGEGKEYRLVTDGKQTVEYEYEEGKIYNFDYNVYYSQTNESTHEYGRFKVDAGEPGTKELIVYTGLSGGGHSVTVLYVVIKEKPRLTPEISFDPNGAIDYVANEKYVYEYDGQWHNPIMKLSYNNENIELIGDGLFTFKDVNDEIPFNQCLREIGTYIAYYGIGTSYYKNEADQEIYSSVSIEIIIEIIDSNQ